MSQLNCFIFVCKNQSWKRAWKDGPTRHSGFSQAFSPLPKTFSRREVMLAFLAGPVDTHTTPPLEKGTRFKTNYYIYAYVRALGSNVRATSYTAMWIYVRGILREETVGTHAALYMLYVPGTETFAANGCHYRKRGLQKSESLRAGLRYCCCGLGDNYLMNKLPNPLAKHTSYST